MIEVEGIHGDPAVSRLAQDGAELTLALSAQELNSHIEQTRYRPHQAPTVLSISVDVTNTGDTDSDETLLAFAVAPNAGQNGRPLRSLRRYERVEVRHGAAERVTLDFSAHDLGLVDEAGSVAAVSGSWTIEVGQAQVHINVLI